MLACWAEAGTAHARAIVKSSTRQVWFFIALPIRFDIVCICKDGNILYKLIKFLKKMFFDNFEVASIFYFVSTLLGSKRLHTSLDFFRIHLALLF